MLPYPTMDQVEKADRTQMARWHRFLPYPGYQSIKKKGDEFLFTQAREKAIMDRIEDRFKEMGGMSEEISKIIGWGE